MDRSTAGSGLTGIPVCSRAQSPIPAPKAAKCNPDAVQVPERAWRGPGWRPSRACHFDSVGASEENQATGFRHLLWQSGADPTQPIACRAGGVRLHDDPRAGRASEDGEVPEEVCRGDLPRDSQVRREAERLAE